MPGQDGALPAPPGASSAPAAVNPPAAGAADDGKARSLRPGVRGENTIEWSDLSNLQFLTKGAMCEILVADLQRGPSAGKVVVKVPRADAEDPMVAEHDLEVEYEVLRQLNHRHIIRLIGAGRREQKPQRFIVLEYLELGTLADKLENETSDESAYAKNVRRAPHWPRFHLTSMLERAVQLASALEYMHHEAVPNAFCVHRDLKPDNIGFKADGTLKLFDFGLARVVQRLNRVNARYEMTGETGSMRYMAPEVVESLPYNEKVDVYAFGLLLWEMLQLRRVFTGMSVADFYNRVVNAGARPALDPAWPGELRRLIQQCWHPDVERRPTFHVIMERLRNLYNSERAASKLSLSAVNLTDPTRDGRPAAAAAAAGSGGGGSGNSNVSRSQSQAAVVRAATTTHIDAKAPGAAAVAAVGAKAARAGKLSAASPAAATDRASSSGSSRDVKEPERRRSSKGSGGSGAGGVFKSIKKLFGGGSSSKGGAASATMMHTAPEAQLRQQLAAVAAAERAAAAEGEGNGAHQQPTRTSSDGKIVNPNAAAADFGATR